MFYVGEYFGCGFREPGDLPGLDWVDELFIQAVFRLVDIFTDRLDDRERVEKWRRSHNVTTVLNMVQEGNNLVYVEPEPGTTQDFVVFG